MRNLRPSSLVLKITDSLLMDNLGSIEVLNDLVAEGVGLSIDDFGTGYSSLSRLALLPVGQVKIDKSCVEALLTGSGSSIVPAIVLMAHSVGLAVVAEGVEEPEQLQFLRRRL